MIEAIMFTETRDDAGVRTRVDADRFPNTIAIATEMLVQVDPKLMWRNRLGTICIAASNGYAEYTVDDDETTPNRIVAHRIYLERR